MQKDLIGKKANDSINIILKDAFDENGKLKNDLFHSLNKIGHALHDLDPVFEQFSRSPQLKELSIVLNCKTMSSYKVC